MFGIVLGCVLSGGLGISFANAQSIGMSPAEFDIQLFSGTTRNEYVRVARETTEGDMLFTVTKTGADLVVVPEETTHIIPAGEQSKDFFFTINSAGLENGSYDEILIFTYAPPLEVSQTSAGMPVEYALKVKIHVEILDRPEESVPVSIAEFPMFLDGVTPIHLSVQQNIKDSEREIVMEWAAMNKEQNPLEGVVSRIRITKNGMLVFDEQEVRMETLPLGESGTYTKTFLLNDIYPSGRYEFHVWIGDHEAVQTFWVIKPALQWCLGFLGLSLFCALLAVIRIKTKQKKH